MDPDMYHAISNASEYVGGPRDTGFLNRRTGEIIFVYDNEGDAKDWCGVPFAEALAARRRVEAAPDEWLEIPKYDRRFEGEHNEDAFIQRFLTEHGLA